MSRRTERLWALALGLVWAGWWVFFATAESVVSHRFIPPVLFVAVMFGTVAIAWKWPAAGAALFCIESLASIAIWAPMWLRRFAPLQVVLLFGIMPAPPMAAAILLLLSRGHGGRAAA